MEAEAWSDYLCPWAYLGQDRSAHLHDLGVRVTTHPFDLHPEMALTGRPVRVGGRLAEVFDHIAAECHSIGLPFVAPTHVPNSRRALQASELVRTGDPIRWAPLHQALFAAVFVHGLDIGDPAILDAVIDTVPGLDVEMLRRRLDQGDGWEQVQASTDQARERGVTGTPAWLLDGRLLVPGVQPRETMERWVNRLRARPASAPEPSSPE